MIKPPSLPHLTGQGYALGTDEASFGFLEPANDLLDDTAALRERFETNGYLYVKNFLPRDAVLAARRSIVERLAGEGVLDPNRDPIEGILAPEHLEPLEVEGATIQQMKVPNFRPDLSRENEEVTRVCFGPELQGFYNRFFGEPALHFDYTWLRLVGPGLGTSPHCDWVYMSRGSRKLMTSWIPYGVIPLEVGGLILLEGSHRQAARIRKYLDADVDDYCENKPEQVQRVKIEGNWAHQGSLSNRPDTLNQKFKGRWLTSEQFEPGDFLTFRMDLIHASLDNHSDQLRISTDIRYQPASHPADDRWMGAEPPGHGKAGKRGRIC